MSEEKNAPDISKLSFEQALSELENIVASLEQGNVPLEQSIEIYSRGEILKKRCQILLREAEEKVEKIRLDSGGEIAGTDPLDS